MARSGVFLAIARPRTTSSSENHRNWYWNRRAGRGQRRLCFGLCCLPFRPPRMQPRAPKNGFCHLKTTCNHVRLSACVCVKSCTCIHVVSRGVLFSSLLLYFVVARCLSYHAVVPNVASSLPLSLDSRTTTTPVFFLFFLPPSLPPTHLGPHKTVPQVLSIHHSVQFGLSMCLCLHSFVHLSPAL